MFPSADTLSAMSNCPRCSAIAPDNARFCPQCALPLADARRDVGERRVVTVLFCDVQGSTALAESRDPEEWAEIMEGAFGVLIPEIERLDGNVVRVLGDALLAFFGAPIAHEDDPERALLASLALLEAAKAYAARLRRERGVASFEIRVGINTGLAVLGDVGAGRRLEYTAMGDAVNVAARLQAAAPPGGIVVSEATARTLADRFTLEPLGALEMRGRSAPITAFRLAGRRSTISIDATPFVGRASEIAVLHAALEDVREGRGRSVSVVGDPGIGKSRFVAEMHADWIRDPRTKAARWLVSRGQSYARTNAYAMIRPLLLALCDTDEARPAAEQREMIARAFHDRTERPHATALALALGVADDDARDLEGEALADEIVYGATALLERALTRGPLALVFDDLHWSDQASADLLMRLAVTADRAPILFLLAYRPDRQSAAWRVGQRFDTDLPHRYSEIKLRPLDEADSTVLLARFLGNSDMSAVHRALLAKAEGNPLFIEQLCRALPEMSDPHAPVSLPDTLQSLLAARIDQLPDSPRHALQAASVIGRTFSRDLLSAITGETNIDADLAVLLRSDMLAERAGADRSYAFRHPLVQEAAYAAILQRRRRELHGKVADVLAGESPDAAGEHSDLVAYHLAEARDPRAFSALSAAAERAMRLYTLAEAVGHFDRAIALAPPDAKISDLYARRGRALELQGRYDEAITSYEAMREVAVATLDRRMEGEALLGLATVYGTPTAKGDVAQAAPLLERATAIARELGDRTLLARLLWSRAWQALIQGFFARGIPIMEESIAIARELGLRSQLATSLNDSSHLYREVGRLDRAIEVAHEARSIFQELGDQVMVADGHSTTAYALFYQGKYHDALTSGALARRISEETNNMWGQAYSLFFTAAIQYERGDWGTALHLAKQARTLGGQAKFAQVWIDTQLCEYLLEAGDPHAARQAALEALDASDTLPYGRMLPLLMLTRVGLARGRLDEANDWAAQARKLPPEQMLYTRVQEARVMGELAIALGDPGEALRRVREASRALNAVGFRPFLTDLVMLEGDALLLDGDAAGARAAHARAKDHALAIGSRRALWRAQATLGELDAAHIIVTDIANSLEGAGLREAFLSQASVRAIGV